MTDRITFKCTECEHPVSIDQANPPIDDDILTCMGCGQEIGQFYIVKNAMIKAAKDEIEKITTEALGVRPMWR